MKIYLKATIKANKGTRAGIGVELFRLDAAEAPELTEEEEEAVVEDAGGDNSGIAVMRLYEEIGENFWTGGGVTAKSFAEELDGFGDIKRLHLHINCLGGDAFAAHAMHSTIKDNKAGSKTAYIDGVCASAATLVACGADRVVARYNTNYMVHYPWGVCMGDAEEMKKAARNLEAVTVPIVNTYKKKVGNKLSEEEIHALMAEETWMSAEEALENGFVDTVRGNSKGIARVGAGRIMCSGRLMDFERYRYRNAPKWPLKKRLLTTATDNTEALFEPEASAEARPKETEKKKEKPMTREEIAPELLASIQAEARTVERARLEALDSMAGPGLEEIIKKAKADGKQPNDIALEALAVTKAQLNSAQTTSALARDAAAARSVPAGDAPMAGKPKEKPEAAGARFIVNAFKTQRPRGLANAGMMNGSKN